ncbi:MAG TPA: GIDE domain-containing protein [Steroidobacteraceae bacterium]|nr:GIDE domain-containing protein [Steroidobacteraceae bacterium]
MVETQQHYQMIAAAAGLGALYALYGFFNRLRRELLVADTPIVRIRSAAQGYVKVTGRALPAGPGPTAAPLSSRPCVWWDYKIDRQERDSRGRESWHTVERASSVELFALSDGDAECLVGPVQAEVTPTIRSVWYGTEPRPPGPPPPVNTALLAGPFRYTERLLEVGAQLSVLGELRSHSEVGDLSAATAAKLHEWKQDQASLLARFDADHDGRLDAAEWEAARAAAAGDCAAQNLKADISRVSVISAPTDGEPFLIAPLSPERLEQRERRYAWLYLVLGLVSVTACAWALHHAGLLGPAPG